ncbi:hypothetical protein M2347_002116 [Chryseobacterium sp. H1D6B]|uniref:T9SS type A sorting domain-containing protein n=1 Tax=Chryseobacterium sp. H1D6B TaxID=2940588 RepID=UPI0015C6F720|nr:T9SS type A sorting domain-containing protein [Chryseobacterium sp. H1D6B]MDH6252389.1 hypothetical protein [Chryseobacterium sp. H1D6B]
MKYFLLFLIGLNEFCNAQSLVSIKVIPENPTLGIGTYQRYKAIGFYTDNTSQDISNSVVWSSAIPTVSTVSNAAGNQGFATNVGLGSTTIGAMQGSINGITNVSVVADADNDGAADSSDNCPFVNNPSQVDIDSDGIGDACDCNTNSNPADLYATSPKITAVPGTISPGVTAVFYSVLQGGKLNPSNLSPNYQWKKNGINVGTNSAAYSDSTLANNDVIVLTISSGNTCAAGNVTSNSIATATLSTADSPFERPSIFPNPARDIIHIKNIKNISKINIYDSNGRMIDTTIKQDNQIDISSLSNGNYLLEVITRTNKKYNLKFIKN